MCLIFLLGYDIITCEEKMIVMSNLNEFQQNFIKALSDIQEICVQQVALNQNDNRSLQDKYYDITSEIIIRIMELIDGYGNIGRLKVICEKSGEELKNNPYVELHDVICDYLKGTD